MYNKDRVLNFELNPVITIPDVVSFGGYEPIRAELLQAIHSELQKKERLVLVIDCYHGVSMDDLYENLVARLDASLILHSEDAKYPEEILYPKLEKFIVPEDRTYGMYFAGTVDEFFEQTLIDAMNKRIMQQSGLVVVYGIAATKICDGDMLVYANVSRQEIKARYKKGLDNWGAGNYGEEPLKKEKRGSFIEWRVLDRHKRPLLKTMDYLIDCDRKVPVMMTGGDLRKAVDTITRRPFKAEPIFIRSVWGGHWMQKVLGCGQDIESVGWGIIGIMDHQRINMQCGAHIVSFPCVDLINLRPREILGNKIFYFWGYRCPLKVNFLDTWGGGNLSLQVHPTTDYAFEVFNSSYGHHESYYIMDSTERSSVYLGLKEGTKVSEMVEDLKAAQEPGVIFDDKKYVNNFPVKKHDHVFIPGGTVHSSGEGTLVLEIDLFCFATFKLWDWGRIDFDGRPRPINIDHGQYTIQEDFQGDWVRDNLISKQPEVARGYGWRKEDTSTMPYEPMGVNRYWFTEPIYFETNDHIIILVLIEGEEATVESVDGSFEPMVIHYAEALFVPAAVGKYLVKPCEKVTKELGLLEIFFPL